MDKALTLRVLAALQDKLSGPLGRIRGASAKSSNALTALRDKLRVLNAAQRDINEFRSLGQGLRSSRAELAAAQQRVATLARELRATSEPTRTMRRDFDRAKASAAALKEQVRQQSIQMQTVRTRLNDAGYATSSLVASERRLRAALAETNSALSQQQARLKAVAAQQQRAAAQQARYQRARESYERGRGLAGNMAGLGAGGLVAGGGMLYAGTRFIAPGFDFDASMSKVQALARLDKQDAEMQALRKQARDLGASTMFTAGQAAEAQGFLAMAGFNPQAILDSMPGMLSLAKAGDTDLAMTADIASNILTGFDLQARQMPRVADVLVGTFTRSNTSMLMLGDTMKYVAPVAAGVGQDLETAAAMAGKLGDAGIQGSMGGTALRAILGRLAAPPKMAADALKELGIKTKTAQGNMRAMPDILLDIYNKTKKMGNAQRAGYFKHIAGEEAFSALQVLTKQAGSGELQKFIATLRQTTGEAEKVAGVMADNARGDLDEMSSAWEDLGIEIEEMKDGPLRGLIQGITEGIGAVKAWVSAHPALAGALITGAAGLALLVAGLGGLTLALASVLGPFVIVRYAMTLFGIRSLGLAGALGRLGRNILPMVGRGILFIGRALMMNPIGLAVTAIGLAALAIYQYWRPITAFFGELWQQVQEAFAGGIGAVGALLVNWSPMGLLYQGFAAALSALSIELPAKFTEFGGMLMQGLINGITSMAGAVKDAVTGMGDGVVGWFKEKLGIRSPSRVFVGMGEFVSEGAAVGIARAQPTAVRAAQALAASVAMGGALAAPSAAAFGSGEPIAAHFDTRPPVSAGRSAAPVIVQGDTIHIHIAPAAGMSAPDIARAVEEALRQRERDKAARARSAYLDND